MAGKNKKKKVFAGNCLLRVVSVNDSGELTAVPAEAENTLPDLKIYVSENKRIKPALGIGDEFLGRVDRGREGVCWVKPLARTSVSEMPLEKLYGVIEKRGSRFYLKPMEKNARMDYLLDNAENAGDGDFVAFVLIGERKFKEAKIVKNFGRFDLNKAAVSIILEKYGIPADFPRRALQEAENEPDFDRASREDLTGLPLVTIDGEDSKDFDDAVYARRLPGGFLLVVAIADVAFYVRDLSELDREAYRRGNSVYLPNRVVPMLPERLSNDLCSLNPKVERAAIACFIKIDKNGEMLEYDFRRAVIKSAARLTYKEVQEAVDGICNDTTRSLFPKVIQPLYEAYHALEKARRKRGALELDVPELKIRFSRDGKIQSVSKAEHYVSHSMVEEFMIAANVAAAKALKNSGLPVMYRVHEKPSEEKLKDIQPLLRSLKMRLPEQPALKPEHFNRIMEACAQKGYNDGIAMLILRLQSQARYSPDSLGHFGLGLADYVHFTSPIRRYSDLLIHRALIKVFKMPDGGGLDDGAGYGLFEQIGEHISSTERKAVQAERDMTARYLSSYLEPSVGADFEVKISGITTAGLFVCIESLGAEGLIPMRTLPDDDYEVCDCGNVLKGRYTDRTFSFGAAIKARLTEASAVTGGLIFKFVDENDGVDYDEKGSRQGTKYAALSRKKAGTAKASKKSRKKKIKKQNRLKSRKKVKDK